MVGGTVSGREWPSCLTPSAFRLLGEIYAIGLNPWS